MSFMSRPIKWLDNLRNVVAGLNTGRDKQSATSYYFEPLTDDQLLNAYRGAWLPRKIVDIPAFDACRKWRSWNADRKQITKIEQEETRLQVKAKVLSAYIAARLWGGAALYINTGEPNPEAPFDPSSVGKGGIKSLVVLTKEQLAAGDVDDDITSEFLGRPRHWRLTVGTSYDVEIHPSRLIFFSGAALPEGFELQSYGWGDSVLQAVFFAIRQSDGAVANVSSLLYEAKIDVVKIPDLMNNVGDTQYEESLIKRFTLAGIAKGNNGTYILDTEEEYEQKKMQFTTIPEVLDRFFQNVSGAADIPMTRLFGMSPGGLNSTGDSDLKNYYDRIASIQVTVFSPAMARFDEALVRSALGSRPKTVFYVWQSLWQNTETEIAKIGKVTAETVTILKNSGLLNLEALTNATANTLIEKNVLPGLEQAIEKYGINADPADLPAAPGAAPPGKERSQISGEVRQDKPVRPSQRLVTGDSAIWVFRDEDDADG